MDSRDNNHRCSKRNNDPEWRRATIRQWITLAAIIVLAIAIWFTFLIHAMGCEMPSPVVPFSNLTTCEQAFDHFSSLGCDEILNVPGPDEILKTEDDINWITFCNQTQESGIVEMNLDAAMNLDNCEEIAETL